MERVIDVKLEYLTPVLGINPVADIATEYMKEKGKKEIEKLQKKIDKTKNPDEVIILQQRLERLLQEFTNEDVNEDVIELQKNKVKIFARNSQGALCWYHYQLKGHLKELAQNWAGISWLRHSISKYVDIFPYEADYKRLSLEYDLIPILRNGQIITESDELFSRPLTSWVNGQYIVTINSSEKINLPAEVWFRIVIWDCGKKDKIPTPDMLRQLLEYGQVWGHSGWRTARHGRYKVKEFLIDGMKKKTLKISKKNDPEN